MTAVRAGSAGTADRGAFSRRGAGGASASTSSDLPGGFSMILMRESALFCGRGARASVSRTMSCFGACVLPWRIANTVDSSSAA